MTDAEPLMDPLFAADPEPAPSVRPTTLERAFQLARSGSCVTIEQIADQLKAEQMESVDSQLFDRAIRHALRQACAEGRQAAARNRPWGPGGGLI
jgi:hypothetical protein